jgi:hypothetical protein
LSDNGNDDGTKWLYIAIAVSAASTSAVLVAAQIRRK